MKQFSHFYSDERIISYLCKIRIGYAQKRNKRHLLNNLTSKKYQGKLEDRIDHYDRDLIETLDKILPKRRMWVTLDKKSIYENGIKLNSIEKNKKCLLYTIKKYRKNHPTLPFVIELNKFIKDIQDTIEGPSYVLSKPSVLPEKKEANKSKSNLELKQKGYNECRPITRFGLKDRIILSITNKFLTQLFDGYFDESALAFRSVGFVAGKPLIKNHHTAIEKIIEYKKLHKGQDLYVAECDMKKFYDAVNHKVCLSAFYSLIEKVKKDKPSLDLSNPIQIFEAYLNSYSFHENVLVLNGDASYWKTHGFTGEFPWVEEDIKTSEYYQKNPTDRVGVPQGGALSGLIANIILDRADKEMNLIKDLFYIRYCDDMILMHPENAVCQESIDKYVSIINANLLFNHHFKPIPISENKNYGKPENLFSTKNKGDLQRGYEKSINGFWKLKSKGPYKWGELNIKAGSYPWIGFVGYEIHYTCQTRVRIRSLKKEIEKQKKVVHNILKTIQHSKVVRNNTVIRSAYEKLNGMSVGRVEMFNFHNCKHDMCWAVGFKNLNFNIFSKRQLKTLDRNKYKQVNKLKKKLRAETVKGKKGGSSENDEIVEYHKPYSYFYQAGERKGLNI